MLTRERLSEIENAAKDDHQAHPDWAGPDNSPRRHRDELLEEVRELRAELLVATALEFALRDKLITALGESVVSTTFGTPPSPTTVKLLKQEVRIQALKEAAKRVEGCGNIAFSTEGKSALAHAARTIQDLVTKTTKEDT